MDSRQDDKAGLAGPSLWPVGVAVGIACVLVGLVVSWWVVAIGGGITIAFGLLWVYELAGGGVRRRPRPTPSPPPGAPARRPLQGPRSDRRGFLSAATLGIGAVIGAAVTVPPLFLFLIPPFLKQGHPDVDLGPIDNFPEGKWLITKFFLNPKQGDVSKRTAYIRYNGLTTDPQTGKQEPSFTIISNRCAHLGCPVQPNGPVEQQATKFETTGPGQRVQLTPVLPAGFGCPCHGGQYDTEGNRTAGPPVRALDRYDYAIRRGRLYIIGEYSVGHVTGTGADAEISKYNLALPGDHVDGWEQIFYPFQAPH